MVLLNCCTFFLIFTIFSMVLTEPLSNPHLKSSFANMLKTVVHANESKISTLKRIAKLQDYMATRSKSTEAQIDITNEPSNKNDNVIPLTDDMQNKMFITRLNIQSPFYHYENLNQLKLNHGKDFRNLLKSEYLKRCKVEGTEEIDRDNNRNNRSNGRIENTSITKLADSRRSRKRRKTFVDKCAKEAKKLCREACIDAYKSFCQWYSCSARAKKRLRIECKYTCKSKFKTNSYSDVE